MIHHRLRGLQKSSGAVNVADVFATSLYTGNSSTQTITNGINLSGEGGMVWFKNRDNTGGANHFIHDTIRERTKYLNTNLYGAESASVPSSITSWNSNGFTLGSSGNLNISTETINKFVAWTFRQAPRFFDVVTISHTNGAATNIDLTGLATLGLVIAKITNATGDWIAWHRSLTASNNLRLNTTAAQTTTNAWLSVSGTTATLSASAPTGSYVVYGFAHDPDGVIQCGSFTTDGSGNATVTLGWEPQYTMVKRSSNTSDWIIADTARQFTETAYAYLAANETFAETRDLTQVVRTSSGFNVAWAVGDFIYMAIKKAA